MKSTDFTTFLNTPGCSKGRHTNVKPIEPEKITGNLQKDDSPDRVIEHRAPVQEAKKRPPVDAPLVRLKHSVAASLKQQQAQIEAAKKQKEEEEGAENGTEVAIGESCKNNGCKETYNGSSEEGQCRHHPGVPVFHEGMKFWSCCQKKTSEFQEFLDQQGCDFGSHKWVKEESGSSEVECRYDWHQTATHVTVAIYAKKYDPAISYVEVNPVRLRVHVYFPLEKGAFDLDSELRGIIDVNETSCSMMGTKMEIKMKKDEIGSWPKLEIPKIPKPKEEIKNNVAEQESRVDALDLDDLDLTPQKLQLTEAARTIKPAN